MDTQQLKMLAGRIRAWLNSLSININHSQSLDYSASLVGLRTWPEVQALPDVVDAVDLNHAATVRLAKRILQKHNLEVTPELLITMLRRGRLPPVANSQGGVFVLEVLARSWREAVTVQGLDISVGHALEIMAAALGYNNAQHYRSEPREVHALANATYWLVDVEETERRVAQLGPALDTQVLLECLNKVARAWPALTLCFSASELSDEMLPLLDEAATNNTSVGSEMATTNCSGPFYSSLELDSFEASLAAPGEEMGVDFDGTVYALDNVGLFCGDTVNVTGRVSFYMEGRRLCTVKSIEVLKAELDWSWAVDEETDSKDADRGADDLEFSGELESSGELDEEPWIWLTKVQALAEELDISEDQAALIEDAEINPSETSSGVPNGCLINLAVCPPSSVIEHLVKIHGSTEIWVMGGAFDRLSPFDQM